LTNSSDSQRVEQLKEAALGRGVVVVVEVAPPAARELISPHRTDVSGSEYAVRWP
jgi:hypothetical protein